MTHSISIVLPAQNEAIGLQQTLWQIRNLHPDAKLIVVNDVSTDETAEVAASVKGVICTNHPVRIGNGGAVKSGARSKRIQASPLRSIANRIYNGLASYMMGFEILDLTSGFRAVRRKKFMEILYLLPNKFSCPTTSTMALLRSGYFVIKSFYQYGDALVHHVIVDISHWHCFRAGFIISLQRYSR